MSVWERTQYGRAGKQCLINRYMCHIGGLLCSQEKNMNGRLEFGIIMANLRPGVSLHFFKLLCSAHLIGKHNGSKQTLQKIRSTARHNISESNFLQIKRYLLPLLISRRMVCMKRRSMAKESVMPT